MECVPDWSALPTEMLEAIARRCTVFEDFTAFREVCTSWRAAAAKDVFVSVSKVPLLMLAEEDGTSEREFYSLAKGRICTRIPLPDLMGKRCSDVGFGWILTSSSSGEVCLMKPFSSARIQLPNFKTFPDYMSHGTNPEAQFIRRARLTLVVDGHHYLGFWNSGAENWTRIEGLYYFYLTCWKGKIYILDLEEDRLSVWDSQEYFFSKPCSELDVPMKKGSAPAGWWMGKWQYYMVGSSDGDQLLLIRRNNHDGNDYINRGADHFDVFKVDLVRGELIAINGLGKDAVFLGVNAAVCVDATEFPGALNPNCIYFTGDCIETYIHSPKCHKGGGKDMGFTMLKMGASKGLTLIR